MKTYSLFLSSTFIDLKEHRRSAIDALDRLGQKVDRMEIFGARPDEPKTGCLKEVESCDLFVGIYAHRYGFVPVGSATSITEQEFDQARKSNKPIFCFLINEDHPWPPKLIEDDPGRTKLTEFKHRIETSCVRDTFTTADDLALKVGTAIGRYLMQANLDKSGSEAKKSIGDVKTKEKDSDLDKVISPPEFTAINSAAFFATRFASAFPGLRDIAWFESEGGC